MSTLRTIGGHPVSAIGFGAMSLGAKGNTVSESDRLALLDRAYALGCRLWDTANIYGTSESTIGAWLALHPERRSQIFLATKFGYVLKETPQGPVGGFDASPQNVRRSLEESLKRLGVQSVDLLYAHRVDPKVPIELTVGAMAELVAEGKVAHLGLSECSASALRRAHAVHPIAAVQVEYSPFTLDIEHPDIGLLETCKELGVCVVAYSPLGRGLLTGAYTSPEDFEPGDIRRDIPRYQAANFPKLLALVEVLRRVGQAHSASPGQVALAWILAQGPEFVPIPGTSSIRNLEENWGALTVQLTPEEVAEIRQKAAESGAGDVLRNTKERLALSFQDSPPLEE
ncbi:Aldo/keto reductase [Calocera viscosa TUFC12733]|uniref:Aldo/keto reductase n=1 Tax=Calocera viscosa (strain TUFC12733) TaxID=1330018 RepID=A0A167NBL4_CALVF|nr:Aldo/keto reductase [Calocera viscosa TUFC12733]